MLALSILFLLMAAFWGWVSFRDARWDADEEGPSVWDYAFFGIVMCFVSSAGFLACLAAAVI